MGQDLFSVAGKRVLVTGGSRGIGAMLAAGLAGAGARVLVSSRKAAEVEATAAAVRKRGGDCVAVAADVGSLEGARELAAAARERLGGLDVLVNNAGATWGAPIDEFPPEGWDKVFDVNVRGVFFLTAQLLDLLRAAATDDDPARIINIGSVDGLRVPEIAWENYPYSASKAAVHMLTRHLACRLAHERITVNAIAPGFFDSRMTAFLLADPGAEQEVVARIPMQRIGRPDDMEGVVRFLASRAGAYVTGAVVTVDGGVSLAAHGT